MIKIIIIICILPLLAHADNSAECIRLGYTDRFCSTPSLRCPYDDRRMKCIPCDRKFRTKCKGAYDKQGDGDSCGGMYQKCICKSDNYYYKDEVGGCVEKPSKFELEDDYSEHY